MTIPNHRKRKPECRSTRKAAPGVKLLCLLGLCLTICFAHAGMAQSVSPPATAPGGHLQAVERPLKPGPSDLAPSPARSATKTEETLEPQVAGTIETETAVDILEQVSGILGLPVMRVVAPRVVSADTLRTRAREALIKEHYKAAVEAREFSLKAIGLLPKDYNLREELLEQYPERVGGYYDAYGRMVEIREELTPSERKEILIHEYVHALQEQNYHLEELLPSDMKDADRAVAVRGIIEGQAVRVSRLMSRTRREVVQIRKPARVARPTPEVMALLNPRSPLLLPDSLRDFGTQLFKAGAAFIDHFVEKFGNDSGVFYALPVSTEQLIHFDKYLTREKPSTVTLKRLPNKLEPEWKRLNELTFGEMNMAFWLGEEPGQWVSSGWGGDRLATFISKSGRAMAAWRTVWDTEEDAIEFLDAARDRVRFRFPMATFVRRIPNGYLLGDEETAHGVIRLGTEVRVVIGADAEGLEELIQDAW